LPVYFLATIRATDIVRDADILPLYREAGILYILLGIETTSPEVIRKIRKGSSVQEDYRAIHLLREHCIYSIMGHIVGFEEETWQDFRTAYEQLSLYDGDYLNVMYVTPHRWTQFAAENRSRKIVQLDQSKWDYRHQVFEQKHLRPWQLLLAVKWLELRYHLRPKRLLRILTERHPFQRRQLWWNLLHTSLVWCGEILAFLFATTFAKKPVSLARVHGDESDGSKLPVLPWQTEDASPNNRSIPGDQIGRSDGVEARRFPGSEVSEDMIACSATRNITEATLKSLVLMVFEDTTPVTGIA
jgi:anaerobic magnesium-protoporphyrin IX monomethyl ester cyclase